MAIKRLHEGFGIGEDSCISGIHPMRAEDPPGLYLGNNPEALGQGLYITYWEACEIATKIGYPMPEVYEAQKALIDEQARELEDLKRQLNEEVNSLQLKAVITAVTNSKKETLNAVEGYTAAVRARIEPARSTAKPGAGAKAIR